MILLIKALIIAACVVYAIHIEYIAYRGNVIVATRRAKILFVVAGIAFVLLYSL